MPLLELNLIGYLLDSRGYVVRDDVVIPCINNIKYILKVIDNNIIRDINTFNSNFKFNIL